MAGANEEKRTCEVFYDGGCPLCRAEIGYYQRRNSEASFIDMAAHGAPPPEIDRSKALARFHVRRPDGALLSGAAAFSELWKATPGWRWLGRLCSAPPALWIAEALYRIFLIFRPLLQRAARTR